MKKLIFLILLFTLILSGFSKRPEIKDIREIAQDHRIFTMRQEEKFNRLDTELQKKADAFYNKTFFSPWHREESSYSLDEMKWEFEKYSKNQGYGKKGKKHPRTWVKKLIANAHIEDYPNGCFPAITLQNTDMRVLPTSDAHLSASRNCVLPFDNMQNSATAADTPIYVSHIAKDKKWVLAETHFAKGWIPTRHIARVDADFMKRWESAPYVVIVKDKTPIYKDKRKPFFYAQLGSFFPKVGEDGKALQILIAVTGKQGKAAIKKILVPKETAALKPLPLTATKMAEIANELMNEPYGWGGLGRRRDCSSTLMDIFAPFGIWLPRNSSHQAKETGVIVSLRELSPEEKEKTILKQGIPYFTILWLKGHVMLYIGEQEGRVLVFHNFWSIRTRDDSGKKGRQIVGRAAITTLQPGQELRQEEGSGGILHGILGMTFLWPPPGTVNCPEEGENHITPNRKI